MTTRSSRLLSAGTTALLALVMVFAAATPASAATITGISPTYAPVAGGTVVSITGSDFVAGATSVAFGATVVPPSSVTVNSATSLTVVAPAHAAGGVDVTVTTDSGSATEPSGFLYQNVPTLSSASPTSGPLAGGTLVTLSGTGLFNTSATIGGIVVEAQSTTNTSMSFVAPAHAAGNVAVTVTNAGGTSNALPGGFTYANPVPVVSGVTPNSGPAVGGSAVTLSGTGFTGVSSVKFGSTNVVFIALTNSQIVVPLVPAGAVGERNIYVTTPAGTSVASAGNIYTYLGAPTLSYMSPAQGRVSGGNTVQLSGSGFNQATTVTFGTASATFTKNSDTSITATVPPGVAGTVNVSVDAGSGNVSNTLTYTYVSAPIVTSVTPNTGSLSGETTVTISGTGLASTTSVAFGGTAVSGPVTVNSDTSITVVTPAHAAGVVNVVVTTPGGIATLANGFTYVPGPTVTGLSAAGGPVAGGNTITITGTGLAGAAAVLFGSTPAIGFTVVSSTTITATVPAQVAGGVTVSVTGTTGTSASTPSNVYTYYAAPTISTVSPAVVPTSGGTSVTITGTNLSNSSVSVDSFAATITASSATSVTFTTFGHNAGAVQVSVSTPGGTATATLTYLDQPSIAAVTPTRGPLWGGTLVTVYGQNFTPTSTVAFDGVDATNVTVISASQLTAISPAHTAGLVTVAVTTEVGTTSYGNGFEYVNEPTVTSISPAAGPTPGGTIVTITGTDFTPDSTVRFGTNLASSSTFVSSTTITATSPAGAVGTVDVRVQSTGGTSATSAADQFTYVAAPTITSVSPNAGTRAGSTSITITGTNLTEATDVTIDDVSVAFTGTTTLTFTTPAHAGGTVSIEVTSPGGTASIDYRYEDAAVFVNNAPPTPLVGTPYSYTFTASGFPAPTFALGTGVLPAGLTLSPEGVLSGTPTSTTSATFTVVASNGVGTAATSPSVTLTATPTPGAPEFTGTTEPPKGTVGEEYEYTFEVSGTPAPTITVYGATPALVAAVPTLPPGLTLSPAGVLSGTPTTAGTYEFTLSANNGITEGAIASFSLVIAAAAVAAADDSLAVTGADLSTPLTTAALLLTLGVALLIKRRRVVTR